MKLDDYLEDQMENSMMDYTGSNEYQAKHTTISEMCTQFKNSLSSKEQQEQFNQILNLLSDEHADFAVAAFKRGFREGHNFDI